MLKGAMCVGCRRNVKSVSIWRLGMKMGWSFPRYTIFWWLLPTGLCTKSQNSNH